MTTQPTPGAGLWGVKAPELRSPTWEPKKFNIFRLVIWMTKALKSWGAKVQKPLRPAVASRLRCWRHATRKPAGWLALARWALQTEKSLPGQTDETWRQWHVSTLVKSSLSCRPVTHCMPRYIRVLGSTAGMLRPMGSHSARLQRCHRYHKRRFIRKSGADDLWLWKNPKQKKHQSLGPWHQLWRKDSRPRAHNLRKQDIHLQLGWDQEHLGDPFFRWEISRFGSEIELPTWRLNTFRIRFPKLNKRPSDLHFTWVLPPAPQHLRYPWLPPAPEICLPSGLPTHAP